MLCGVLNSIYLEAKPETCSLKFGASAAAHLSQSPNMSKVCSSTYVACPRVAWLVVPEGGRAVFLSSIRLGCSSLSRVFSTRLRSLWRRDPSNQLSGLALRNNSSQELPRLEPWSLHLSFRFVNRGALDLSSLSGVMCCCFLLSLSLSLSFFFFLLLLF